MFDLRYHVASLAAVFVALLLGIFVGVGLSGKGFVSDAERENLQAQIDALRSERDSAAAQAAGADRRGVELDDFAKTTYPQLVSGMLEGKNVGVVFIGSVDQGLANTVRRSVDDAGGRVALVRALRVPLDAEAVDAALRAEPETRGLAGIDNRERLGRELARELITAGPNPVFDRLARVIVEEQSGAAGRAPDAGVVSPQAPPQPGPGQGSAINLNTVTFEQLRQQNLSVTQATRLLAHRERLGRFGSVDELDQVPGFPQDVLEDLKSRSSV